MLCCLTYSTVDLVYVTSSHTIAHHSEADWESSLHARVRPKILPSILYHIGNTPMVRLDRIAKAVGLECELGMFNCVPWFFK
jgi:hypothetical protein